MINASYTAKAAAMAQQKRLDVISNNLANVNTYGYKSSSVSFKDTLYNTMVNPAGYNGANLERGSGVLVSATNIKFTNGAALTTGNDMDFCIEGDGFFMVEDQNGNTVYTRNGAFYVSIEADGNYLVNGQSNYILDENGQRITLPPEAMDNLAVDGEGNLSAKGGAIFAKLGIKSFPNSYGLEKLGNNTFGETISSGAPYNSNDYTIMQGYLEGSNVDMVEEMTLSIRASRAFSFASRCITTADEMDGLANNIRG
ncbi:flagellar hook-basal body protein [Eubacteriales bacterium OttesenSCG-928-M02]|nr:flagellar hook-basal body protein [Eubacteriales bacterium OttesenSCG-928-M02]